jgi:hypothetical protein
MKSATLICFLWADFFQQLLKGDTYFGSQKWVHIIISLNFSGQNDGKNFFKVDMKV